MGIISRNETKFARFLNSAHAGVLTVGSMIVEVGFGIEHHEPGKSKAPHKWPILSATPHYFSTKIFKARTRSESLAPMHPERVFEGLTQKDRKSRLQRSSSVGFLPIQSHCNRASHTPTASRLPFSAGGFLGLPSGSSTLPVRVRHLPNSLVSSHTMPFALGNSVSL